MTTPVQVVTLPDFDPFTSTGVVPSPCIGVCRMSEKSGLCEGCFRTLEELRQWSRADDSYKRSVWVDILQRQDESKVGGV